MALTDLNARIMALRSQLDALRPLNPEQERRIMDKFRLDWNYHSNHLEGNQLTHGETKALLLFNITAQGKPLKDHLEIKGHNEAILWIEEVVRQQRPLTENFIRELHKLLLGTPYQVDAITPDGQPTQRWIQVGQYKSAPNHVKTVTGEIYRFATPEETPALMHDLLEGYRAELNDPDQNGWVLAATFHYRFIRIHPFDDGNGRLARILMNFILLGHGFPPVVIKTGEKSAYFRALQQADAGNLEAFAMYIGEQLAYSLDLMLRGAQGADIEDDDDLDKQIALLKASLQANADNEVRLGKSKEVVQETYAKSVEPLFRALEAKLSKFDELFTARYAEYKVNSHRPLSADAGFAKVFSEHVFKEDADINFLAAVYQWRIFKMMGTNIFGVSVEVTVHFEEFVYRIRLDRNESSLLSKLYHQVLSPEEIKGVVDQVARHVLSLIQQRVKE
jgi:Fic family protein